MNLIAGDTMFLVIHQPDGLAGGGFDGVVAPPVCGISASAADDATAR
ncbi:hypothetical protein [Kutzneria buriramensis]|uniref:Uncharacterized protein n=1 Tax=Kutzneria buriramensis TaxID=1045776 RepID=A0A3E0HL41_9PSEU|nr:hypothetical protein [Kutzneria buriramensis]REH47179.1 hypothetical protein BCF44_106344 [Kutzneria buriramensis]